MPKREIENDEITLPQKKRLKTVHNENMWNILNDSFKTRRCKTNLYVCATETKNYLIKDPVIDWFNLYFSEDKFKDFIQTRNREQLLANISKEKEQDKDENNVLFEKGKKFEEEVSLHLHKKFGCEIVKICENNTGINKQNFERTKNAMFDGIPIIEQAVLINESNKTCGIADLLVRSDYLNRLVDRKVLETNEEFYEAPCLNGNYHYRVIDIKWSHMTLCADGKNIRNEGLFPAYKGQIAIYNCALGNIQGYTPNKAYIMAKSWRVDKKDNETFGYCCFDLLGEIDYAGFDNKVINETKKAINWIKELRLYGFSWNPEDPKREEMFGNANCKVISKWNDKKMEICKRLGEISQIWYVGTNGRLEANKKGIKSWRDKRCNCKNMNITGSRSHVIDAIININRDQTAVISPSKISKYHIDLIEETPLDFYIDFETINNSLYKNEINIFNSEEESENIFLIGVGYKQHTKWNYHVFYQKIFSPDNEVKIFDQFAQFIMDKSDELDPNNRYTPRLYHWTQAERHNFDHLNARHEGRWSMFDDNVVFVDLYDIFINEPIVVKNAFNFKLKEIAKAMYEHGLIKTTWNIKETNIKDGLEAMMSAITYYKDIRSNCKIMNNIIEYNEVDCKVLFEIVDYLRKYLV
jgi:hypothetical protein